jgi:Domain of unknown function (DUF4082)/Chitobiase/beta-hexosaminidase C-terminal domain/Fibronectin type III domain
MISLNKKIYINFGFAALSTISCLSPRAVAEGNTFPYYGSWLIAPDPYYNYVKFRFPDYVNGQTMRLESFLSADGVVDHVLKLSVGFEVAGWGTGVNAVNRTFETFPLPLTQGAVLVNQLGEQIIVNPNDQYGGYSHGPNLDLANFKEALKMRLTNKDRVLRPTNVVVQLRHYGTSLKLDSVRYAFKSGGISRSLAPTESAILEERSIRIGNTNQISRVYAFQWNLTGLPQDQPISTDTTTATQNEVTFEATDKGMVLQHVYGAWLEGAYVKYVNKACIPPAFSPEGGALSGPQTITITSPSPGATIRYTLDGSKPSRTTGLLYTSPININASTTVRAIAYSESLPDSALSSAVYELEPTKAGSSGLFAWFAPTPQLSTNTSGSGQELGVAFSSRQPGTVSSLKVWHQTGVNVSSYTARLWSPSGSLLGTATIPAPASEGWAEGPLPNSAKIEPGEIYVVSYTVPAGGKYAVTPKDLSDRMERLPLAAIAATNVVAAGTYPSNPNALGSDVQARNPWADIRFFSEQGAYVLFSSQQAAASALRSDGAYELGTRFRVNRRGSATALRVWRPAGGATNYSARLWSENGQLLGKVDFTAPNTVGWVEGTLAQPISLDADKNYVVSYSVAAGVAHTAQASSISSIERDALVVLEDAGVQAGATGTFPTARSAEHRLYFADIRFIPVNEQPVPQAQFVATPEFSPPGGSYTFPQTITVATSTAGASLRYTLDGTLPTTTNGTIAANGAATFTLNEAKTVRAIAFKTGIADSAATSAVYTALVVPPVPAGGTLFGPQLPANFSTDNNAYELGLRIRTTKSGSVTAIRFYKGGTADTMTGGQQRIGKLWLVGTGTQGTLLASAVFGAESNSGWQEVALTTPVPLTVGNTYIVSVNTSGFFSSTANALLADINNAPLVAPASTTAAVNGVFGAPGQFPLSTFNATHYFRDLRFMAVPTTPAAFTVRVSTGNSLQLAWTDLSDNETGFKIERGSNGSGWSDLVSLSSGSTGYTDSNIVAGRTYEYRLRAVNSGGSSDAIIASGQTPTALQTWKQQKFGVNSASSSAADLSDPDGDGSANLLEYAFGTEPLQAGDSKMIRLEPIGGFGALKLTFYRARTDTELTYTVQASTDLNVWTDVAVNPGTVGSTVEFIYAAPTSANITKRFLRLKVSTP